MMKIDRTKPAVGALAAQMLFAGLVLCSAGALAQGAYRDALINFGMPELTEELVLAFETQGIPQEGLATTNLTVQYQDKDNEPTAKAFSVELATDDRESTIGLMMRPYLAANSGMLFFFDEERQQSFWMRNTLIPLDIIYIKSDGTIDSIVQGEPLNTTPLPSDGEAQFVLELNAGTAERLGFGVGDLVTWED